MPDDILLAIEDLQHISQQVCCSVCDSWEGMTSKYVPLSLLLMLLFHHANSTMICGECRPIELQEAPGVGISLSPGYGSVAVRFFNGSTVDVLGGPASSAYLEAMNQLERLNTSQISCMAMPSPISADAVQNNWLGWIGALLPTIPPLPAMHQQLLPRAESKAADLDILLDPLVSMIQTLFNAARSTHDLKYNKFYLALPDFFKHKGYLLRSRLESRISILGLEAFPHRYWTQSQAAAFSLYGLEDCWGDPSWDNTRYDCERYHDRSIQNMLSIELDEQYFGLRLMKRDDGVFFYHLGTIESYMYNGTESLLALQDSEAYWSWVRERIAEQSTADGEPIDLIALYGTQAKSPELIGGTERCLHVQRCDQGRRLCPQARRSCFRCGKSCGTDGQKWHV